MSNIAIYDHQWDMYKRNLHPYTAHNTAQQNVKHWIGILETG